MPFASQFRNFDPVSGDVPSQPFRQLPQIANRARALFSTRSVEQIEWAAITVDWMIEDYFSSVKKHKEIERLKALAYQGYAIVEESEGNDIVLDFACEEAMRFFEPEETGSLRFISEMEQDLLDILWMDSSLVGALKECIGWYDLEHDSEFPDIRDHEYFAVLSVWLVADAMKWLEWPQDRHQLEERLSAITSLKVPDETNPWFEMLQMQMDLFKQQIPEIGRIYEPVRKVIANEKLWLSSAANKAIDALDAVSFAEHLKATGKAGHTAVKQEIKRKMDALQIARHAMDRAAQELVRKDWARNPNRFRSAEKAADHYVPWLTKQNYNETNKYVEYAHRTVADWIRAAVKIEGKKIR